MRYIFLILISLAALPAFSQNPNYDSTLARSLGADEYGMKSYVLVILKTGPNLSTDKAFRDSCFAGHFSNMERMTELGKLVVAGPMGKNDASIRGIFILACKDIAEAEALLQGDLAVKEGLLKAEYFNWYGSAALPLYLDDADRIWQKQP